MRQRARRHPAPAPAVSRNTAQASKRTPSAAAANPQGGASEIREYTA